jgi:Rps23 Pro-64 3,4-dihydroxylase Tpa1-like proline 4-hydroxylase
MKFVNEAVLDNATYQTVPFAHTVIDDFLQREPLTHIFKEVNDLRNEQAQDYYTNPKWPYEYNKFGFESHSGEFLSELFTELNSNEFVEKIERLTGIYGLIRNDTRLKGAGVHRITKGGYLGVHTDFNSYYKEGVKLDRRINLLIYLNPQWKEEYNGQLWLCDKNSHRCVKKILPLINRCVIFNTTSKSLHGHPEPLNVPDNIRRQSIAVYYYTENKTGDIDFEGEKEHPTLWYDNIQH